MISARKRRANRANARASTGPRTAKGKARAARNARKHGLRIPVLSDPALAAEVEALAHEIAGSGASVELYELARKIAEAQVDLVRVRTARNALLSRALSDSKYLSPKGLMKRIKLIERIASSLKRSSVPPADLIRLLAKPEGPQKFALILSDLATKLAVMDRYEGRALSRRKFAIRAFDVGRQQVARADAETK